jgi:hypothetical protein
MRLRHGLFGNRHLVRVIAAAADQRFVDFKLGDTGLGEISQKPLDLGHDFGTDAVAGEKKEFMRGHEFRLVNNVGKLLPHDARKGKREPSKPNSGTH